MTTDPVLPRFFPAAFAFLHFEAVEGLSTLGPSRQEAPATLHVPKQGLQSALL